MVFLRSDRGSLSKIKILIFGKLSFKVFDAKLRANAIKLCTRRCSGFRAIDMQAAKPRGPADKLYCAFCFEPRQDGQALPAGLFLLGSSLFVTPERYL
jgi:hypothetical protein